MWLYKLIQNSKCAVWILTGTYSKCWTYFWGKMALFWVPQIGRSTGETRYFRRSRKDFGWEEFRLAICSIQTETWSIFSQILPKKWSKKKHLLLYTEWHSTFIYFWKSDQIRQIHRPVDRTNTPKGTQTSEDLRQRRAIWHSQQTHSCKVLEAINSKGYGGESQLSLDRIFSHL